VRAAGAVLLLLAAAAPAEERLSAVVLSGPHNHDAAFTSPALAALLEETGRFAATVAPDAARALAGDLRPVRLFVVDTNGPRWGPAAEEAFSGAVRDGAGVVVVHAADNAFTGWRDYERMIALGWREGSGHGTFHALDLAVIDRNHPVTAGLPPLAAHRDELYHGLVPLQGAPCRVLLAAHSSKESGGSGKEEPVALVTRFGRGRVFHTTLGHVWPGEPETRASLEDPQLRLLLARGAEWAATGRVTIRPRAFGLPEFTEAGRRPVDPWVYRCVLDGRPRTVVVALDPHLYLAYDAAQCALVKAWGGRLALRGSVHDASHGPQPASEGAPYLVSERTAWRLLPGDATVVPLAPRWLGYRVAAGRVVLRYRAEVAGRAIDVEESPEHAAPGEPVLERVFTVAGLRQGEAIEIAGSGDETLRLGDGETRFLTRFRLLEDPE